MPQLIWSDTLTPTTEAVMDMVFDGFGTPLCVPNTQAIAKSENDFSEIPDRKALRLMSRTSVLLSAVMMRAKPVLDELLRQDPFRVATYCAIDNGSESYSCVKGLLDASLDEFAEKYRRLRSPKHYLKQLPNLAPAQAGIFLGLVGPLNVFHHSRFAGKHAIEQMLADFKGGRVDVGVVASANSFEDPLLTYRNARDAGPGKILREGAGAMIFRRGENGTRDWTKMNLNSPYDYGIATHTIENSMKGV
jgi:hypothetical protein